jgi:hypothetical protein
MNLRGKKSFAKSQKREATPLNVIREGGGELYFYEL